MDERPPADERAGARRWAAWLGLLAAAVPLVENAGLAVAHGGEAFGLDHSFPAAVLSLVFGLVLRTGVPLVGAVLVLRGGRLVMPGLAALAVYGLLQLPGLASLTWHLLAFGPPPWFWFGLAVPVAAGIAAVLGLRDTSARLGERDLGGGRGLAAAGAFTLAAAAFLPAVTTVGSESTLVAGTGIGVWHFPWVLFEVMRPIALLVPAVAVLVIRPALAALAVTGVVAVSSAVGVVSVVSTLVFPDPLANLRPAIPALGLEVLGLILLVGGSTTLWKLARA